MFDFKNNRTILIILAVLVVYNMAGMTEGSIIQLILTLPGLLIAITFHEFAHAWAADKLGDDTPRYQGRLTLNPIKHLDPVGTVLLLFAHFGWGKPVQINPRNFKGDMGKGEVFVSFAGPATNFILAFVLFIIYYLLSKFGVFVGSGWFVTDFLQPTGYYVLEPLGYVQIMLYLAVVINIALGVFNLIPLPPLDGSKIFMNFLPFNARQWFIKNEMYFHIAFLIIFFTGMSGYIIGPILDALYKGLFFVISSVFGIFI